MPSDLDATARDLFTSVLESAVEPEEVDLRADMATAYGLTSLNKIVFLMSLCEETGVDLANFAEPDVAAMRTLGNVISAFAKHIDTAA